MILIPCVSNIEIKQKYLLREQLADSEVFDLVFKIGNQSALGAKSAIRKAGTWFGRSDGCGTGTFD